MGCDAQLIGVVDVSFGQDGVGYVSDVRIEEATTYPADKQVAEKIRLHKKVRRTICMGGKGW